MLEIITLEKPDLHIINKQIWLNGIPVISIAFFRSGIISLMDSKHNEMYYGYDQKIAFGFILLEIWKVAHQ